MSGRSVHRPLPASTGAKYLPACASLGALFQPRLQAMLRIKRHILGAKTAGISSESRNHAESTATTSRRHRGRLVPPASVACPRRLWSWGSFPDARETCPVTAYLGHTSSVVGGTMNALVDTLVVPTPRCVAVGSQTCHHSDRACTPQCTHTLSRSRQCAARAH